MEQNYGKLEQLKLTVVETPRKFWISIEETLYLEPNQVHRRDFILMLPYEIGKIFSKGATFLDGRGGPWPHQAYMYL